MARLSFTDTVARLYKHRKRPFVTGVSVFLIGIFLLVLGLFMSMFIERRLNESLEENLVVSSPNSKNYDKWITNVDNDSLPPAYMNYYLWNLTNLDEVLRGGFPVVEQVGPYRYRKYFQKQDINFIAGGDQVYFREKFFYVSEGNTLPLDLKITNLNPAYMLLMSKAGNEQNLVAGMTPGVFSALITQLQTYTASLVVAQVTSVVIPFATQGYYDQGMTEQQFCGIWANSTQVPPGFEIFGVLSVENISSQITFDQCHNLLSKRPYSMADSSPAGVSLWATFDTENTTSIATVQKLFGLDSYQVKLISIWRTTFQAKLVKPIILQKFGVSQTSDLGLLQWAQGSVLNGQSLATLANLVGYPEFYFWQVKVGEFANPYIFNLTRTQELLFGPYGLTNTTNFNLFVSSLKKFDIQTIQKLWGLNVSEAATLALYFQYIGQTFSKATFLNAVNQGSGLFVTKTVQEWLWNGTDPLLALFVGDLASEYHLGKNNSMNPYTSLAYTGKNNLDKIAQYLEYDGVAEYCGVSVCGDEGLWVNNLKVSGTNGRNSKPKLNSNFIPTLWSTEFLRPINFFFDNAEKLHGVEVYKYFLDDSIFQPNPDYFQVVQGFGNLTHAAGAPVFASQAHMLGVNETYFNKVKGQSPDPDQHRITISLEPFSGATFAITKKVQLNGYIEPENTKYATFYPNIPTDIFFPLLFASEEAEITQATAKDFQHAYYDTLTYQKVAFWGGVAVGLTLVVVGFALSLRLAYQSRKLLDPTYEPLGDNNGQRV